MVVEHVSKFVALFKHMNSLGIMDTTTFLNFRVWWYEEILKFLQLQANNMAKSIAFSFDID